MDCRGTKSSRDDTFRVDGVQESSYADRATAKRDCSCSSDSVWRAHSLLWCSDGTSLLDRRRCDFDRDPDVVSFVAIEVEEERWESNGPDCRTASWKVRGHRTSDKSSSSGWHVGTRPELRRD